MDTCAKLRFLTMFHWDKQSSTQKEGNLHHNLCNNTYMPHVTKRNIRILEQYIITEYTHIHMYILPAFPAIQASSFLQLLFGDPEVFLALPLGLLAFGRYWSKSTGRCTRNVKTRCPNQLNLLLTMWHFYSKLLKAPSMSLRMSPDPCSANFLVFGHYSHLVTTFEDCTWTAKVTLSASAFPSHDSLGKKAISCSIWNSLVNNTPKYFT